MFIPEEREGGGVRLYIARGVENSPELETEIRAHFENWKRIAEVVEM